jgi:hypothetical protein
MYVGAYPQRVAADFLISLVADMNEGDRDFDFDGPLPHWISRFGSYELRRLDLTEIDLGEHDFSADLADVYAGMDPATMPPIIFDPLEHSIVDGNHRVQGAVRRGDRDVLTYVGVTDTAEAGWRPMDD